MRRIEDEFTDLNISAHKKWKLRHPEQYKKSERDRKFKFKYKNPIGGVLKRLKQRAKNNGLLFDLKREDIKIPEFCPVLGLKLFQGGGKGRNPNSPSVDRVDNEKGYIKDNIRIISNRANSLKSDATVDELTKIIFYMKECVPFAG